MHVPEQVGRLLPHHPLPDLPQIELEARRTLSMYLELTTHLQEVRKWLRHSQVEGEWWES